MPTPYIGICDFTDATQSQALLRYIPPSFPPHRVMVGVMMSYKTLYGIGTKWAKIFPDKYQVHKIFTDNPRAMNTIHYADYTKNDPDLARTLWWVTRLGGENLDAIQLDMIWPDPFVLEKIKRDHNIELVLQVGKDAMTACGDIPRIVAAKIESYADIVDHVLLDRSMGKGQPIDPGFLVPYIEEIKTMCPRLGIAVAGGLGPYTLWKLRDLIASFPDISLDAQSRLRLSMNAEDPIDWPLARAYLYGALLMYRRYGGHS